MPFFLPWEIPRNSHKSTTCLIELKAKEKQDIAKKTATKTDADKETDAGLVEWKAKEKQHAAKKMATKTDADKKWIWVSLSGGSRQSKIPAKDPMRVWSSGRPRRSKLPAPSCKFHQSQQPLSAAVLH